MTKSVCIVAMGESRNDFFRSYLGQHGPDFLKGEVWALNLMATFLRCTRVLHMDPIEGPQWGAVAMKQFSTLQVPIYTSELSPLIPTAVEYPLVDVVRSCGGLKYFNSTVAYAVGLAIHEKFEEISLFGCDFTYPNDPHANESGRACVEFWLGFAMARGVKINVAERSTLMDAQEPRRFYGYREEPIIDLDQSNVTPLAGVIVQRRLPKS